MAPVPVRELGEDMLEEITISLLCGRLRRLPLGSRIGAPGDAPQRLAGRLARFSRVEGGDDKHVAAWEGSPLALPEQATIVRDEPTT